MTFNFTYFLTMPADRFNDYLDDGENNSDFRDYYFDIFLDVILFPGSPGF